MSYRPPYNYQPWHRLRGIASPALRRRPYNRFSPNMLLIAAYIVTLWHTNNGKVGTGYVVRLIRAGAVWSAHAFGAAWDCYLPFAAVALRNAIATWLVDNANALGLQLINDYAGRRRWIVGQGWQSVKPNPRTDPATGWGRKGHLHIECHVNAWGDTTPLAQRGLTGHAWPGWDTSDIQEALNRHGYHLAVDGIYGPRTTAAVKDWQQHQNLPATGQVDPDTWGTLTP